MSYSFTADAGRALAAVFILLATGVKFDFDTRAIHAAPGAALPLDQMSAGITANFSSPDANGFTVGNAAATGYTLTGFSGNYRVPGPDTTVLEVVFDQPVVGASTRFTLLESLALPAHSSVKITACDTLSGIPVEVGSAEAPGSEIAGDSLAGGTLTFGRELPFNGVRIEILAAAREDSRFLCDNLSVTPQSTGGGSLLMANPNWNITLTDSGYSDFLLDNTPGFEGREYLSGEWGAAIGYTRSGTTESPRWLEPNFLFPDWSTNSNFTVVMPITLIASNAGGLPVAQSILSNGGIEGIDDHSTGKPSEGVHLSIDDNWQSAPYSDRLGNDYFAPNDRWIAGAQRYNLGTIADGQSATVDMMLSILTGTTVQVIGGGGGGAHTGSGSCNGGSSHVGGADFEIEDVAENGTFFGEKSEADDDELDDRIEDGEFILPGFEEPGGLSRVWNLRYTGSHNGRIRLSFAYDPALLPPGFDETRVTMYHFHEGAWEQLIGVVDPVKHTVTVSTESRSPFMLGVSTPNAVPALKSEPVNAATLCLTWQGDTTGWILQENTTLDPAGWTNSTAPVTQTGQVF